MGLGLKMRAVWIFCTVVPKGFLVPAAEIAIHSSHNVAISAPWGFPIREDIAFTNAHGADGGSLGRRAKRALERLQKPLGKILEPDEVVLYFSRGQIMPGSPERYMLGVPYRILTRAGLILTNRRLLHVSLKRDGQWNRGLRSARWGDVKEFQVAGRFRGKLLIKYRQGSSETYWHIPKHAAQKLQILLDALLPASKGETAAALGMASLCPQCLAELSPRVYECPNCRLKFKDEKGALLHGLLIPGGGYFYAGLNLLGIAHDFLDVSILSSVIVWILAAIGKVHPPAMPGAPQGKWVFVFSAFILTTSLVADIWLSIRVAQKAVRNFIPIS
jgi:hypothetical protein